jgi:hypothetical protein
LTPSRQAFTFRDDNIKLNRNESQLGAPSTSKPITNTSKQSVNLDKSIKTAYITMPPTTSKPRK